jgi:hypothetical protein
MSKIALSGNASGTGTFTFAAPGTNTDRTLTLPDATGTVNVSGLANEVPAGSAGAPAIYPTGDSNTGIFFPAADTIAFAEGGAESMRIDASGNVGIGTSSPGAMLDLTGGNAGLGILAATNRLRFTDTDSTLVSDQTTGSIEWYTSDTDHPGVHAYIGTLGFNTGAASLTFGTGVGGSAAEYMRITSTGEVEMPAVYSDVVTGRDLYIASDGQLGYVSSTRASKTNIQDLSDVSWLYSLNPVSFQYRVKNEDDTYSDEAQPQPEYGLIAEDVELVNPDLVFYDETENGRELRGIQYSRLIAPLLKALQEQQALITDLTARLTALEAN